MAFNPIPFTGVFTHHLKSGPVRVALRDHKGRHIRAHPDGRVDAAHQLTAGEVFEMVHMGGDSIAFKNTQNHKFLCAEHPTHFVVCNRDKPQQWETFHPHHHGDGSVSFKSHHGHWLCSEDSGRVIADRGQVGAWEHFWVQRVDPVPAVNTFSPPPATFVVPPAYVSPTPEGYAGGLIIDRATYHNMDVTAHLQNAARASNGHLFIPSGTDYNQYFHKDPAFGVPKLLTIIYQSYPGAAPQTATFKERDQVKLDATAPPAPASGLIIDRATYHNMDVTAQLQNAVRASQGNLFIPSGTDYNQYFQRDPAFGVPKLLTIIYQSYPGAVPQTATFKERDQVKLDSLNGLIIDRATYHNMDVTAHLQSAVRASNGHLFVSAGTDYNQYFLRDPAPGVPKILTIIYRSSPSSAPVTVTLRERDQIKLDAGAAQATIFIDRATYHTLDVTSRLQQAVASANGRLFIPGGTDYNQFFQNDPAPGVPKVLSIVFRAGAQYGPQTMTFRERDQVQIEPFLASSAPVPTALSILVDRATYHNMDVTQIVQQTVAKNNGHLVIAGGTDYNQFFQRDPAPGVPKVLTVVFRAGPQYGPQTMTFKERDPVKIDPFP